MFNIGDVVTVNPTLSATKPDGTGWEVGICDAMLGMAGRIATIDSVLTENVNGEKVYKLAFDGRRSVWSWQESMLIPGESTTPKIELPETCMDISATYEVTDEKKKAKVNQVEDLIDKYDYAYTDYGCGKVVGESLKQKGWLYNLFSKHPNWDDDGHVVIKANIKRPLDMVAVRDFVMWANETLKKTYVKKNELRVGMFTLSEYCTAANRYYSKYDELPEGAVLNGMTRYDYRREYDRMMKVYKEIDRIYDICSIDHMMVSREIYSEYSKIVRLLDGILTDKLDKENPILINERQVNFANQILGNNYVTFKEKPIIGQKICKYIGKICRFYGINKYVEMKVDVWYDQDGTRHERTKDYGYNYHFAALGDAINPNEIERDIVLSADIIDFLTMSFGYKYASCMTIDKENKRGVVGAHYSGCYSGGTLSYALDNSTFVAYVRPTESELASIGETNLPMAEQSKFKRCLFFLGEDKLIQSRVYPDGRDVGGEESDGIATQIRNIVQKAITDMLNVSNMWTLKRGASACCEVINTGHGSVHYRDYESCSDCNVSYLRRVDGLLNTKAITVGAKPICPCCGNISYNAEAILCESCYSDGEDDVYCSRCGNSVGEDDAIYIDDSVYCCSECAENAGNVYTYDDGWHDMDDCRCDDRTGEWWYYNEDGIETEDGNWYIDNNSAERAGYVYVEYNNGWYPEDDVVCDEESGVSFVPEATNGCVETEDGKYFVNADAAFSAGYIHILDNDTWIPDNENDEAV